LADLLASFWRTHRAPISFFWRDFGKGFTHPSVFLADPSRTRPKVFGGKVSRCLKKFGGPIRAPISFWLAGFWWSFWREVWVKVWQPQKVWREVLAGILAGSFTQPQKVAGGKFGSLKEFWREVWQPQKVLAGRFTQPQKT